MNARKAQGRPSLGFSLQQPSSAPVLVDLDDFADRYGGRMSAGSNDLIVSVSGIRGIVGAGLTPGAVLAFAQALGTYLGVGPIVLSRDSRPSGDVLRHAVLAGLRAAGCAVHDLGVAPTPTCGIAVRRLNAAGAIQITASHNPAPWNGLKLFGSDGAVLSAAEGLEIKQVFDAGRFQSVPHDQLG